MERHANVGLPTAHQRHKLSFNFIRDVTPVAHVHAVAVRKKTGLAVVNDGSTRYQIEFAEQRETARTFFYDWMAEFGIEYRSPIYDYATTGASKNPARSVGSVNEIS